VTNGRPFVTGAVEGDVDEAMLRRILDHVGLFLGRVHGRKGKQSLLQSLMGYNNAAWFVPWVVMIDLDGDCDCAPPCVQKWLPNPSTYMYFRVAVRAVESWLLADRERMAALLRVNVNLVPRNPDDLLNPKRELINLARRSRYRTLATISFPEKGAAGTLDRFIPCGSLSLSKIRLAAGGRKTPWRYLPACGDAWSGSGVSLTGCKDARASPRCWQGSMVSDPEGHHAPRPARGPGQSIRCSIGSLRDERPHGRGWPLPPGRRTARSQPPDTQRCGSSRTRRCQGSDPMQRRHGLLGLALASLKARPNCALPRLDCPVFWKRQETGKE